MRKLESVQVLRGIAATMVVVMHAWGVSALQQQPHNPIRLGAAGVDIFFVISGFIMATISVGKTPREFMMDRLWRIYPIWWIACSVWLIVNPPAWLIANPPTWQMVMASVTLWPSYPDFTYPALLIGWTLSFEMLFYLSFTLALKTRPIVPLSLFAAAFGLGVLTHHPLFDFIGNPMIFDFLFGVLIAKAPKIERLAPLVLAVGLLAFAVSPLSLYNGEVATHAATAMYRVVFWGVPAALVVYSVVSFEDKIRWPLFAVALGDASYSIYLFHADAIGRFPSLSWVVTAGLALALGLIAHRLIERPIMDVRKNWLRNKRRVVLSARQAEAG